jgi:phosphoribosylformimino-5-aminoimidazole carboxamide ribotide isomerase
MTSDFPGCIVVAADVRDRKVLSHGWTRTQPKLVLDLIEDLNGLPLAGVLVTAVHREEAMRGTDLPLMEDVAEAAEFPVFASGGLGSLGDLRALSDRGVAAAVIGIATGRDGSVERCEEFPVNNAIVRGSNFDGSPRTRSGFPSCSDAPR